VKMRRSRTCTCTPDSERIALSRCGWIGVSRNQSAHCRVLVDARAAKLASNTAEARSGESAWRRPCSDRGGLSPTEREVVAEGMDHHCKQRDVWFHRHHLMQRQPKVRPCCSQPAFLLNLTGTGHLPSTGRGKRSGDNLSQLR